MKIKNIARYFIVLGLILSVFGFTDIVRAETEAIQDFNVNISIQKDGSIFVTENIVYDFGLNQKRGIFRNIPLKAVDGPQLSINVSEVNNEAGEPYQYTTSVTNDILQIKIGNPNVLISGIKTYSISYQVYNSIRTFEDHDELYWNITGNQWPVAIQNVNASVILPDSSISSVKMDCFTGPQGSTQKNCTFNQNGEVVNYSSTQPLDISEGLTLVLGIPLGFIHNTYIPTQQSHTIKSILSDNIFTFSSFFIFFSVFISMVVKLSKKRAQSIKSKLVIAKKLIDQPLVVEYNPPDNLLPIEIAALLGRGINITSVSSVIIDLAVREYIKIRYTVKKIIFWIDKKDFEFIKLKDGSDLIHPADKIIFNLLFSDRDSVKLSDLKKQKTTFQSDMKKIEKDTEQRLYDEGYFDQVAKIKSGGIEVYLCIATAILFLGFIIVYFFLYEFKFIFILAPIILSVGFLIIFFTMKKNQKLVYKLTPKGFSTLRKILGFRQFLQLAEKDKLQLLNAPELQPEMFEKFLPYAMVLGVEDKWAQKFEDIYNTTPNWYEDPMVTSFSSFVLVDSLTQFNSSFNRIFNTTSSGSSSGFGGGGFSGGGSGGGGGGSW